MLRLIQQGFVALLTCSGSLSTKCESSDNKPCMIWATHIDLNHIKLNFYRTMVMSKDINVKVSNIKTRINELKTLVNIFNLVVNANLIVKQVIQIENCNNDKCQCESKKNRTCKKDYSLNHSTCICDYSNYLKSIVDDVVIVCDYVISVRRIVSTDVTNTRSTNVASAV